MAASGSIPLHPSARLLTAHPAGLLAVAKPVGVRSHPNGSSPDAGGLLTVSYDHRTQAFREGERVWFLLHRLDAPTSGVVLLATEEALAEAVRKRFAERGVSKTYYALVRGKPRRREEFWRDRLRTDKAGRGVRSRAGGGDEALAAMRSVSSTTRPPLLSLLELKPKTGRTHQLRIQCAQRRLPIVGDATYGDFRFNRTFVQEGGDRRLFLHAAALTLELQWEGKPLRIRAEDPMPASFRAPFA